MSCVVITPSLVPKQSGVRVKTDSRTGNTHVRRILVESAWAYRSKPALTRSMRKRNEPLSTAVRTIAWKAQHRMHGRYVRMLSRETNKQQTVTAMARELAAFDWDIARQPQLLAA
jgi:hypothetical protein